MLLIYPEFFHLLWFRITSTWKNITNQTKEIVNWESVKKTIFHQIAGTTENWGPNKVTFNYQPISGDENSWTVSDHFLTTLFTYCNKRFSNQTAKVFFLLFIISSNVNWSTLKTKKKIAVALKLQQDNTRSWTGNEFWDISKS